MSSEERLHSTSREAQVSVNHSSASFLIRSLYMYELTFSLKQTLTDILVNHMYSSFMNEASIFQAQRNSRMFFTSFSIFSRLYNSSFCFFIKKTHLISELLTIFIVLAICLYSTCVPL
ncbi:TPA: hypothetical protein DEG21_00520 [Patescibacteria group bacterium]|nr:hypothetical protein [Candidatus Gracilibacteria bacterium]HBY74409.1 hypothetical protein [Candidatus Gracilibacteria bacterium]